SHVADTCPAPSGDFADPPGRQPEHLFRPGSWIVSNGAVQPAVILPTCPDFRVYANYDPLTRTFHDPEWSELHPGRGTTDTSFRGVPQQPVTHGYSGFGTRFVTADGVAVQIKDT